MRPFSNDRSMPPVACGDAVRRILPPLSEDVNRSLATWLARRTLSAAPGLSSGAPRAAV